MTREYFLEDPLHPRGGINIKCKDEHYHDSTGSDIADEITEYITELFNAKRGGSE